jgi:hypothetical protein
MEGGLISVLNGKCFKDFDNQKEYVTMLDDKGNLIIDIWELDADCDNGDTCLETIVINLTTGKLVK